MNCISNVFSILSVAIAGLIFSCQVSHAETFAGRVQFAFGDVQVTTLAGKTLPLKKGDAINEGDTVITALSASAQIKMIDGGFIAVRPNTNLKFDKFVFHGKADGEERSFFSLIKGGFRAITGMIGKTNKENYIIKTVTATIGVRGTDHETFFVPEGTSSIPAGAYSKVNVGETTVTTNRGTINVLPNQMGFAGNINEAPKIVPINTNLYTVAAAPTKTIKQSKEEHASQAAPSQADKASTGGQTTSSQNAASSTTGGAAENTASSNGTSTGAGSTTTPATGDPNTLRTEAMDSGAITATNVSAPSPTIAAATTDQLKATAPPVIVPVIMTNGGTVLNANTLTQTNGGLSTTLTGGTSMYVNSFIVTALSSGTYGGAANGLLNTFESPSSSVSPLPNPTNFAMTNTFCNSCYSITYALSGGTSTSSSDAATGIQWGVWSNLGSVAYTSTFTSATGTSTTTSTTTQNSLTTVINGTTSTTTFPTTPLGVSWITGPAPFPFYLSSALQVTASYNLAGGSVTDGTNVGTVGSASLAIDFSKQTVSLSSLSATVGGVTWTASSTTSANLNSVNSAGQNAFNFSSTGTGNTGALSITGTGIPSPSGTVYGSLTGNGLTGSLLDFSFTGANANGLMFNAWGAAALGLSSATPINVATAYQIGLSSMATIPVTTYPNTTSPYAVTNDSVQGNAFNPSTLVLDASGNPIQWQNVSSITQALNQTTGTQTIAISGGTPIDIGTDTVSGIRWGRWSGGTLTFTPVAGGAPVTQGNTPGGMSWILLPTSTSPIALPSSGTYTYTLAGGTRPTDQLGNMGTVNSASLSANFSTMSVNMALNVTVPANSGSVNFNASAANVPIQQGTYFQAGGGNNTLGTLTCTGAGCGAATAGHVLGVFTQGGTGAAVSYGFETGATTGSPTVVVSGVGAFHK